MNSLDQLPETIDAREVPEEQRLQILPRHFGRHMLTVEYGIYAFMRKLANRYTGGYWTYRELSNGGFYMAPQGDSRFDILIESNGYQGEMSADAAGITACLFALSNLSFQIADETIANHFHQLRDFALAHTEVSAIFAAID